MPIIVNRGQFFKGVVSLIIFAFVLVPLFTPVFAGQTGMEAADDLFNSLSKGSSYYIEEVAAEVGQYQGTELALTLKATDAVQAETLAKMFEGAGVAVTREGDGLGISGDMGAIFNAAVTDADDLFWEKEEAIEARYATDNARAVLFYWHDAFGQISKAFSEKGQFADALFVTKISERALEPAYNFAGITAAKVGERAGITVFLLCFYVVYTVWYGFSIMFVFEGVGVTAD